MKKLYRKGTVHPSPPTISDHLSFLPATILTLAAALSPEDREVLAYLISCSNNNISVNNFQGHNRKSNTTQKSVSFAKSKSSGSAGSSSSSSSSSNNNDHPPSFSCDCFRCYTSYWVRWDASPNRQLIHEIIDAFEDELLSNSKKVMMKGNKKDKKKKGGKENSNSGELKRTHHDQSSSGKEKLPDSESIEESSSSSSSSISGGGGDGGSHDQEGEEKGPVRSLVNFIGERIWGVWG